MNIPAISTWLDVGWILDLALLIFGFELGFALHWWTRGRAWRRAGALLLRCWPTWGAGLGLLAAWQLSRADAHVLWVMLALAASGVCHGTDVWQRVRQARALLPAEPPARRALTSPVETGVRL